MAALDPGEAGFPPGSELPWTLEERLDVQADGQETLGEGWGWPALSCPATPSAGQPPGLRAHS